VTAGHSEISYHLACPFHHCAYFEPIQQSMSPPLALMKTFSKAAQFSQFVND